MKLIVLLVILASTPAAFSRSLKSTLTSLTKSSVALPGDCIASIKLDGDNDLGVYIFTLKQGATKLSIKTNYYQEITEAITGDVMEITYYEDLQGGLIDFKISVNRNDEILGLKLNDITCK